MQCRGAVRAGQAGRVRSQGQGWQGWERRKDDAGRSRREGVPTPAPSAEQALQVLTCRGQQRLLVDLLQTPQTEPPQPVPVLGFGEQRFHPDLRLRIALVYRSVAW